MVTGNLVDRRIDGGKIELRRPLRRGQNPVEVDTVGHSGCGPLHRLLRIVMFSSRDEPEVTARQRIVTLDASDCAQYRSSGNSGHRLAGNRLVTAATDAIQDDPCQIHFRIEGTATHHQGGCRARHFRHVEDQNHRCSRVVSPTLPWSGFPRHRRRRRDRGCPRRAADPHRLAALARAPAIASSDMRKVSRLRQVDFAATPSQAESM